MVESGITLSHTMAPPLAAGLLQLNGLAGLRGWQWLFLLEGLPSIALAVAMWRLLPASPRQATMLTDQERAYLVAKMKAAKHNALKGPKQSDDGENSAGVVGNGVGSSEIRPIGHSSSSSRHNRLALSTSGGGAGAGGGDSDLDLQDAQGWSISDDSDEEDGEGAAGGGHDSGDEGDEDNDSGTETSALLHHPTLDRGSGSVSGLAGGRSVAAATGLAERTLHGVATGPSNSKASGSAGGLAATGKGGMPVVSSAADMAAVVTGVATTGWAARRRGSANGAAVAASSRSAARTARSISRRHAGRSGGGGGWCGLGGLLTPEIRTALSAAVRNKYVWYMGTTKMIRDVAGKHVFVIAFARLPRL